jgi:PAS domain S-box-containing protein
VAAEARPTPPAQAELALTGHPTWRARDHGDVGDAVFQHAPVGIQELDADGRLLRVNPAFCRMTGYTPKELVGCSLADIADRATAPDCIERMQELLQRGTGAVRFDLGFERSDGSLLQGRVTAGVVPGGAGASASLIALVEDASGDLPGDDDAVAFADARIDAVETVGDAVAQARDSAHEKGIDIAYAYASAPVWVNADETQLRQAVDQMLATAVRSTKLGSLAVRCISSDGDVVLEVMELHDPGAAGADLGVVFDDGQLVEHGDTPKARERSLNRVRALARAHNGDVGMTSSPGGGSRITVRLPLARG